MRCARWADRACADQRVTPARLRASGHRFRHATLDEALRHVLGRAPSGAP
jgi:NAD dependent epimerase/dehydratase family enzyme